MSVTKEIWKDPIPSVPLEQTHELQAWRVVANGWKQLFGSFKSRGLSIEWHDFTPPVDLPWDKSFHENSVEICINLEGNGTIEEGGRRHEVTANNLAVYVPTPGMKAKRDLGQHHRFLTLEVSRDYLALFFSGNEHNLLPTVRDYIRGQDTGAPRAHVYPMILAFRPLVDQLLKPQVNKMGLELWYQAKFLEVAASLFFAQNKEENEPFCVQQKHISNERVEKTRHLLMDNLAEPLTLQDLGKKVGCSPYYLSRIFSQTMGMTIPQFLKNARMQKAAELLRSGKYNVTETAYEVGYASLSHFSKVFYETYGCCPGLYPNTGLFQRESDGPGKS
jgi:AraC-like DNA-binding protein